MIDLDINGARVLFTDRTVDLGAQPDAFGSCRHGRQVHGADVLVDQNGEADGFISTNPEWGALVRTADCLPVALIGARGVAMVHAGWRGLAAGVIGRGVEVLHGARTAALGPSARGCCYEVGEEVHAHFVAYDARVAERNLALERVATAQLRLWGVDDVRDTEVCTICDENYFSYRREGAAAGRQGGIAWPAGR